MFTLLEVLQHEIHFFTHQSDDTFICHVTSGNCILSLTLSCICLFYSQWWYSHSALTVSLLLTPTRTVGDLFLFKDVDELEHLWRSMSENLKAKFTRKSWRNSLSQGKESSKNLGIFISLVLSWSFLFQGRFLHASFWDPTEFQSHLSFLRSLYIVINFTLLPSRLLALHN